MASLVHAQPVTAPTRALTLRGTILLTTLLVLLLGALEGYFGLTDSGDIYGSDAVEYLDLSRAISHRDWHSALNPLWSQGYPATPHPDPRTFFPQTPTGDWQTTRLTNFLIFIACWCAFLALLAQLHRLRPLTQPTFLAAASIFLSAQLTLDQVSRVGPDQLLAAFFFATCTLLLRFQAQPNSTTAALLGLTLGLGFLTKAAFLPLGCIVLLTAASFLVITPQRSGRIRFSDQPPIPPQATAARLIPAAAVFAAIVLTYGAALSHVVGHRTFGEAGSLNYAWHVNRLAKWVHWQGGADLAGKAWPKPTLARFAHWQTDPPDFGTPLHPDLQPGTPNLYIFHAPVRATYTPYFDPDYFYAGYHHLFRPRYQLIALGKNSVDLATVLARQPLTYVFLLLALLLPEQHSPGAPGLDSETWVSERAPPFPLEQTALQPRIALGNRRHPRPTRHSPLPPRSH